MNANPTYILEIPLPVKIHESQEARVTNCNTTGENQEKWERMNKERSKDRATCSVTDLFLSFETALS